MFNSGFLLLMDLKIEELKKINLKVMENILVIGGGLMGSSVCWKLAEAGAKVLLLEQQGKNYNQGSSYGAARIVRSLGPKKDIFSYVHNRTVKEVAHLIDFLNKNKAKSAKEHRMDEVYTTSPVSYIYPKNEYEALKKLRYKKQRKDYRRASGDSAFRKFGVTLPDDQVLVREFRKYSGTFNPKELIRKLRMGIKQKGGRIKYEHQVIGLHKKEDFFEVEVLNTKTNKQQTIQAKKVVLAAGPYTVSILKDFAPYFNRLITPKRVLLAYYKIKQERYEQLSPAAKKSILNAHPVFSQIGKEYFSMIEENDGKNSPVFKVGGHQLRRNIIDLDQVWDLEVRKKELKWIKKKFRKYMEMLEIFLDKKDIELVEAYNCVYSMSRTEVPYVTPILNEFGSLEKNLVVIGGMSGVGAKGCLGYGVLGANLILEKKGESSKMYRRAAKKLGNPMVRLHSRKVRWGRLF